MNCTHAVRLTVSPTVPAWAAPDGPGPRPAGAVLHVTDVPDSVPYADVLTAITNAAAAALGGYSVRYCDIQRHTPKEPQ